MREWFIDPASLDAPRNRLADSDITLCVFTESELKEHDRKVAQSVWWDAMEHKIRGVVDEFATYWRERMEGEK